MPLLWQRIGQKNTSNWRIVFKGLDLLMFLLKNGHHRIIEETRDHMMIVRPLQDFRFTDPQTGLDKLRITLCVCYLRCQLRNVFLISFLFCVCFGFDLLNETQRSWYS